MTIVTGDWSVSRSDGAVRYIGGDHATSPTYATVIELHRYLQDLADDASSVGDDEVDITDELPSSRSTDNIINLLGEYNIDDLTAEHLYDGSIIQGTGASIYDGLVNFGNTGIAIQIIQNGAVLTGDWWNSNGGLNFNAGQGISHRFLIKTRDGDADIDGRRIIGTTREYLSTYGEFSINGTSRGNNVLALVNSLDLNNTTAELTISGYSDITDAAAVSSATVDGVNAEDATAFNVDDGSQFSTGQFFNIGSLQEEYQITAIASNVLTISPGLETATAGSESITVLGHGYQGIDVNNDTVNEFYYAQWTKGANTINEYYERMKYSTRDGSEHRLYGLNGELFRGITHEVTVDTPTGTFAAVEHVSWGSGATAGTAQMLAINSVTAGTKIWIQLLTGVIPTDTETITGTISGATVDMDTTITERTVSKPFVGASTGSALIGSYGLGMATASLTSSDQVTDLDAAVINPPNNVTFTVGGLVAGEDRVLVAPWDGVSVDNESNPAIFTGQLELNVALVGATETAVAATGLIPSDTPATGDIRILLDDGRYREIPYTSYAGSGFVIPSTDFQAADAAASGNSAWIAYIDELATTGSATFTSVYSADREMVVIVRDGGGSPIKQFISSATLGSNGGSVTAIRTTDA
jgi:hypothetical protein